MNTNKLLLGLLAVGGVFFFATRARAEELTPGAMPAPIIPGTGGATAPTPAAAPGGGMAPSKIAFDTLKKLTGFDALPRKEASGAIIIGYGHKVVQGDPAVWTAAVENRTAMTPLTKEQADALFMQDVINHAVKINEYVTVPLNQNQYDALTMLIFNIGVENFLASTLLKRLLEKDYAGAADQFLVWNKSRDAANNLVVNDNLSARRAGERELFLMPVAEITTMPVESENVRAAKLAVIAVGEVIAEMQMSGAAATRDRYTDAQRMEIVQQLLPQATMNMAAALEKLTDAELDQFNMKRDANGQLVQK